MPFEVAVPRRDGSFLFAEHFGSASGLALNWSSPGMQLELDIISAMDDEAASENGFQLPAERLAEFERELDILEDYWKETWSGHNEELLASLREQMNTIRRAVCVARNEGLEVVLF